MRAVQKTFNQPLVSLPASHLVKLNRAFFIMKIQNIKKRLQIINEKIERIEELEGFISVAADPSNEYFMLFGTETERLKDINNYNIEISQLEKAIHGEIELLNDLK